jgi:hypothetical protein
LRVTVSVAVLEEADSDAVEVELVGDIGSSNVVVEGLTLVSNS